MNFKNFVGNSNQLNSVKYIQFLEGKATGMKAYQVTTASGFSVIIAIDRGLDIPELKLNGQNISFMSSTGLVNSTYFTENKDIGFMRNFNVGFLTTGGLAYMGSSSQTKGLHGTISNTPAYNFSYKICRDSIIIQGQVTDTAMFGSNLTLQRLITISTVTSKMKIDDTLINNGDTTVPYMILYHNNYGYPFLTPDTELDFQPIKSVDRKNNVITLKDYLRFKEPSPNKEEQVYFHELKTSEYSISSPATNLGLHVKFSGETLPVLNEWKLERTKNYVLGMEPATNNVNGFDEAKKNGFLKQINPGKQVDFHLSYEFRKLR